MPKKRETPKQKAVPESWLASEDPEQFAAAAIRCMGHGAPCTQDGFCHLDGACFDYIQRRLLELPNEIAGLNRELVRLQAEYLDVQTQDALQSAPEHNEEKDEL